MTLKAALLESYASGDMDGIEVAAVELDHASLDAPIYLVKNVDGDLGDPGATAMLPLFEGGPKVPHLLCAFGFVRPGADRDGPTDGRFQIDGASAQIHDLLEGSVGYDEEIRVRFRIYRVLPGQIDAVTGPDDDTFDGLQMIEVALNASQAEGMIAWPDGRQVNVPTGPNAFFDRDNYPALFS